MLQLQTRTNQILLYDSLQGPNLACDLEQLDYTPGEEEIMTIYKDGVYWPSDMIERPEGF